MAAGSGSWAVRSAVLHEVTWNHIVMSWTNFVFAIFKHETTLGGVRMIQQVYDQQAAANPTGVNMVTLVEEQAPLPVVEVRTALARFLASGAGRTRRSAVINEGSGFRAAAVRGVVTGLAMMARLPYPHKVFATVEEAARWFATDPDQKIDSDSLSRIVAEGRRRAEDHPGAQSSIGMR